MLLAEAVAASDMGMLLVEDLCAGVVLLFAAMALVEPPLVLDMSTTVLSLDKVFPAVAMVPLAQDMLLAEAFLVVVVLLGSAPLAAPPQTDPVSII